MKKIAVLFLSLGLSGCFAPTLKNVTEMTPVALAEAEVIPSAAELRGEQPRVVVSFEDHGSRLAMAAGLGATMSAEIARYLSAIGTELIDPSQAATSSRERRRDERRDRGDYRVADLADFAVTASIVNASIDTTYQKATTHTDKKGKRHTTPARCRYSAAVSGVITIHRMPSMTPVHAFNISGSESRSEDTRSSRCRLDDDAIDQLVRAAGDSAVSDGRGRLQGYFAPRGYVLERRTDGEKDAFKITLGRNHGLRHGGRMMILNPVRSHNALTQEEDVEFYELAEAAVTDQIGPDFAWIVLNDKEKLDQVRLGHPVQSVYGGSLWTNWRYAKAE